MVNFFFLQILEKINLTLRGIQVNDFSTFPKCIFITMFANQYIVILKNLAFKRTS